MSIPSWLTKDSRRKELVVSVRNSQRLGQPVVRLPTALVLCEAMVLYSTDIVDGLEANSIEELRGNVFSAVNGRDENIRLMDEIMFGVDSKDVISMAEVAAGTDHLVANILNRLSHAD